MALKRRIPTADTKIVAMPLHSAADNTAPAPRIAELSQQIIAVLFACGDGVSAEMLAKKLGVTEKECEIALQFAAKKYSGDEGIHLIKYRSNYQLTTNPAYANEIAAVLNPIREKNLTRAALETMAIVAYKQPITRTEIDAIRGVGSDYALQILLTSNLIEIVGRKEVLGRPLLYGTTDGFLKRFGLESIERLPSYAELLEKIAVIRTEPEVTDLYESSRNTN
jgi:segregation and condensation protein B